MPMKYLVVVEVDNRGYIIGQYKTLLKAYHYFKMLDDLFQLELREADAFLRRFNTAYYLGNEPYIMNAKDFKTNGLVSTYLIEYNNWWKDLECFITDRSYNPYFRPKNDP